MAFRPMLSGILSSSGGAFVGDFSITAGTGGAREGFASSTFATDLGIAAFGVAGGDFNADGGTVEAVFWNGSSTHVLYIKSGSASAANINIDGTSYTLTFSSTASSYDIYTFSGGTQVIFDSVTYEITVS